jgi:hypothetical protein
MAETEDLTTPDLSTAHRVTSIPLILERPPSCSASPPDAVAEPRDQVPSSGSASWSFV